MKKFKNHDILKGREVLTVVAVKNKKTNERIMIIKGKGLDEINGDQKALHSYYWSVFSDIKSRFKKKGFKYDDVEVSIAEHSEENVLKCLAWTHCMSVEAYKQMKENEELLEDWL